jgi:hypothetical protein
MNQMYPKDLGSIFTMLKLEYGTFQRKETPVNIPYDDYILHAALRKGPVISRPKKGLYVEVQDLGSSTEQSFVFHMSVLDASVLQEQWPEFDTCLVGAWKLQASTGLLKTIRIFEKKDPKAIQDFLLDSASHDFVRKRYEALFVTKNKDE